MAAKNLYKEIAEVMEQNQGEIRRLWLDQLMTRARGIADILGEARLKKYIEDNLAALLEAIPSGDDIESNAYVDIRKIHGALCEELASKGARPADVPLYAFSKRDAIQTVLQKAYPAKERVNDALRVANRIVERLGLYVFDYYIKSREKQIQAASQYARSLIEASLDPLVTISADGKITDVNEATIRVTGVPRDKLIGSDFSNYFTEPGKAREGYQQVFKKGFVIDYPLEIQRKDGYITPVLYNASVYRDEKGNVTGVFAAARDITELKKAEDELKKAQQKALMELAAPVVKVWNKILMIPLIGVMDSSRAELVMETLLAAIEENQAKVAILDVSGIPVVDSLVAKHLVRTVSAAKLMGAESIVTGIRSSISQTMIQLGVDLSGVITKSTLSDGIEIAFNLTNQKVVAKQEKTMVH
jgi:PAS domain S-box-containing protein